MPHDAPATHSPYYPPRAGSRGHVRRAANEARRISQAVRLRMPSALSVSKTLAALIVPGLIFRFTGPRIVARLIWVSVGVAVVVFLAGLGTSLGNLAFAVLISAHAISVSHVLRPTLQRSRLGFQVLFGLAAFVLISQLIYMPARRWVHAHVALPLRVGGRVVVVDPSANPAGIARGDWVAYRIAGGGHHGGHGIVVHAGYGLGPVTGLPGDHVVLGEGTAQVMGQKERYPARGATPAEIVVPEDRWFIWPELQISGHGVPKSEISAVLQSVALVPQTEFVGRPFDRWFFRKQTMP